jgi:hypothetical protein
VCRLATAISGMVGGSTAGVEPSTPAGKCDLSSVLAFIRGMQDERLKLLGEKGTVEARLAVSQKNMDWERRRVSELVRMGEAAMDAIPFFACRIVSHVSFFAGRWSLVAGRWSLVACLLSLASAVSVGPLMVLCSLVCRRRISLAVTTGASSARSRCCGWSVATNCWRRRRNLFDACWTHIPRRLVDHVMLLMGVGVL